MKKSIDGNFQGIKEHELSQRQKMYSFVPCAKMNGKVGFHA